ncbi:hypothetical protein [Ichthyobacterium seriolicida]|uniref:Pkd domain containing protein n=1 Tax=Ichthyobacterium seriolicida TaxID=242600 RepID=A0A1J1E5Y8_9FLAO|nr:hypothetical protein [Ichthyobacterium seriolicida]BAV94742.1 hypothetical protein JBKA6_0729 [Ichthyobacterium seriolicida]
MEKIIKYSFKKTFILLAAVIFVFSCDKEPDKPNPNPKPNKGGEVTKSESALIKSFEFKSADNLNKNLGDGDVRPTNLGLGTIVFDGLPANEDLTGLKPTIVLSNKDATVSPATGVARDFTGAVKYTVTAADKTTTQDVYVTLNKEGAVRQSLLDIEAVKFVKTDNKSGDNVSNFYKALFILKTPARDATAATEPTANGYPADFTARVNDNDIYVDVPFNTALTLVANPAFTATVTLKSLAEGVTLLNGPAGVDFGQKATGDGVGDTDVKFSSAAPITHALLDAETGTGSYTKTLTFVKGSGETVEYEQYRMHFRYAQVPSTDCSITRFALKKAADGAGGASGNAKISVDGINDNDFLVLTPEENADNDGSEAAKAIEYKIVKATHATTIADNDNFKVTGMQLPDGATISTANAGGTAQADPITTGISVTSKDGDNSINFKVVAQDGKTHKFYKFTFKGAAA